MKAKDIMKKDYLSVDKSENISSLLGKMRKRSIHEAIITSKERFEGLFAHFDFFRSKMDIKEVKVGHFIKRVPRIGPETELVGIIKSMILHSADLLPVYEDDKLAGIVDVFSVLKNIDQFPQVKNIRIREIEEPYLEVKPEDSIGKIIHLFHRQNFVEIPLIEKERLAGIIRHKDILDKYYSYHFSRSFGQKSGTDTRGFRAEFTSLLDLPAGNLITVAPTIISLDRSVMDAAKIMENKSIQTLFPKGNPLRGRYTAASILRLVIKTLPEDMQNIYFVGMDNLHLSDKDVKNIRELASKYAGRYLYIVNNLFDVQLHFKTIRKEGRRSIYHIKSRLNYPGNTIASEAQDWDIITALRMALEEIEKQIKSKFGQRESRRRVK